MSDHPYHSIGARQDRARTWTYLGRIADALERIAAALEDPPGEPVKASPPSWEEVEGAWKQVEEVLEES